MNTIQQLHSKYMRDGRSPVPEREITSKVMSSIPGKNTKPELLLRKALSLAGVRGYRLHWAKIDGHPDIAFPSRKIAIFVQGCFWHRCPDCQLTLPKVHSEFWKKKFEKNVARDKKIETELTIAGWKVVVVWECQIKMDVTYHANQIKKLIQQTRR